jgi:hypothetical protein
MGRPVDRVWVAVLGIGLLCGGLVGLVDLEEIDPETDDLVLEHQTRSAAPACRAPSRAFARGLAFRSDGASPGRQASRPPPL